MSPWALLNAAFVSEAVTLIVLTSDCALTAVTLAWLAV
jgi:hypothetical protein